ncbi:NAD-dependent epimerase/dehydratase family protein [Chloroflexota bacterium]
MRIIIIGGSGHVGTYLVPRLVEAGHEVVNVSRGQREPYQAHAAWDRVETIVLDREAAEEAGTFGAKIVALKPDAVIDMICFTLPQAEHLVESLRGHVQHFLHCGTIWVHGPSVIVPTTESQPRTPFGEYGIQKAAIEAYLLKQARLNNFPATCLHPGHIVGPGWMPLNPQGNFNPTIYEKLAQGKEITLPNIGMETVHHVHASDVAQIFISALSNWGVAVGESFHVVSPAAVTLRGYAEAVAGWFGQAANLRYLSWDEWQTTVSEEDAQATWDHIAHSPNCSIERARRILDYQPRYGSLQAVKESLEWLAAHEIIEV